MRTKLTTAATALSAMSLCGLLAYGCNQKPEPSPLSVEAFAEYQHLLKVTSDQAKTITSLERAYKDLEERDTMKAHEIIELRANKETGRTHIESLNAQLKAELLKARQRPESLPVAACAKVPTPYAAVPSAVPQAQYPHGRVFFRRWSR